MFGEIKSITFGTKEVGGEETWIKTVASLN